MLFATPWERLFQIDNTLHTSTLSDHVELHGIQSVCLGLFCYNITRTLAASAFFLAEQKVSGVLASFTTF